MRLSKYQHVHLRPFECRRLISIASTDPSHEAGIFGFFAARGNTTCQVCFKVFACQSALEIHYRSHTKERPFKCPACDRGFSTKASSQSKLWKQTLRGKSHSVFVPVFVRFSSWFKSLICPAPLSHFLSTFFCKKNFRRCHWRISLCKLSSFYVLHLWA